MAVLVTSSVATLLAPSASAAPHRTSPRLALTVASRPGTNTGEVVGLAIAIVVLLAVLIGLVNQWRHSHKVASRAKPRAPRRHTVWNPPESTGFVPRYSSDEPPTTSPPVTAESPGTPSDVPRDPLTLTAVPGSDGANDDAWPAAPTHVDPRTSFWHE